MSGLRDNSDYWREAYQHASADNERLRAALAEAERERDKVRKEFDDYLLDYKAVHDIGTMRDLRTRAEAEKN